jgi:hypothetical protein
VEHVGHSSTRGDGIDSDLLLAAVLGEDANKRIDRGLGTGVQRVFRYCEGDGSVGAHQDDAPAQVEVLVGLSRDEELATSVDVEDSVKFFLSNPSVLRSMDQHQRSLPQ